MNEKELKMKFEEIKGLRDFERGNFTAAIFIHNIFGTDQLT